MNKTLNLPPLVLVVDDDHLFGLLCARSLEKLGLQVICADSAIQAAQVTELHMQRIILMLIDVVLIRPNLRLTTGDIPPFQDGTQLLALLEHRCPHAVCIQMSAYTSQELAENGYHIQSRRFLQKPIKPKTLRETVRDLFPDLEVPSKPILPASDITWCG
jgi:DNA-binding NtrC family response regulator